MNKHDLSHQLIRELRPFLDSEHVYNVVHTVLSCDTLSTELYHAAMSDVSLGCFGLTRKQSERVRELSKTLRTTCSKAH